MRRMRAVTVPLILFLAFSSLPALGGEGEVFYPAQATFERFAREVPLGELHLFKVTLKSGYNTPIFVVTGPDGRSRYVEAARGLPGRKYEFEVEYGERPGAYRVELVVDSRRGDTTAAQFTIWVGTARPEKLPESDLPRPKSDYEPERSDEDTIRLERKLFGLVNEARREVGLPPFPWLEKAAYLGRDHLMGYLALDPRPKRLTHLLPRRGSIADRFNTMLAWPETIRKFPVRDPEIGPEATSFCSEALAITRSLDWLMKEVFLRESAFRLPVMSEFPTHAAVAVIREEETGKLFTATVYVQLNSTRVAREMEEELEELTKDVSRANEPARRAELIRRLGRFGAEESLKIYSRRLRDRHPEVVAAALDALFLNKPEDAEEWVDDLAPLLARAHRDGDFRRAIPKVRVLAGVQYDALTRLRGEAELEEIRSLAKRLVDSAAAAQEAGDVQFARETLELVILRFAGVPEADVAAERLADLPK